MYPGVFIRVLYQRLPLTRLRLGLLRDPAPKSPVAQPFPPKQSVVIIDPPRKGTSSTLISLISTHDLTTGSSPEFVNQLLSFGPERIVYVSCNAVTQARDIGWIVRGNTLPDDDKISESAFKWRGYKYVVESIKGFDLFPQTAHVESVAVLRRVNVSKGGDE